MRRAAILDGQPPKRGRGLEVRLRGPDEFVGFVVERCVNKETVLGIDVPALVDNECLDLMHGGESIPLLVVY